MKLNLGSGEFPLDGYVNVDLVVTADVQGDIRDLEFEGVEEVVMSHLLEHLPHTETDTILRRIRGWMVPGGEITVEVPDMEEIAHLIPSHPLWLLYVYGNHAHPGEIHQAGFTGDSLFGALHRTGYRDIVVESIRSPHVYREGMPCLVATARA